MKEIKNFVNSTIFLIKSCLSTFGSSSSETFTTKITQKHIWVKGEYSRLKKPLLFYEKWDES